MKLLTTFLPLAAVSVAFVVPDDLMTTQIVAESQHLSGSYFDRLPTQQDIFSAAEETIEGVIAFSENAIDHAIDTFMRLGQKGKHMFECPVSMTAFDVEGWLSSTSLSNTIADDNIFNLPKKPHRKPHKKPHKPHFPHHPRSNKTVYELIASSNYTTKLAKLINEYPDVVEILNGTAANYTVFAPTDKAFEKIPEGDDKPSAELIKKVLAYHISPELYTAGHLLGSHTIPTTLGEKSLGGQPQRLRVSFGLRGLAVNFYSKVIAANIGASNGVIHGVDSLLFPPPPTLKIIELLPTEFSTLTLGLEKTGLFEDISEKHHEGGTFFAPSNRAFARLGPKVNAFLFSETGKKYLKALLQYHVVANQTLYSDAFYKAKDNESPAVDEVDEGTPKEPFHVDLPTLLKDKSLSIDISRHGPFVRILINGFSTVAFHDGIAKDGVLHILSSVLIPPKNSGDDQYRGEELTVEDLKERLGPYTDENFVDEL